MGGFGLSIGENCWPVQLVTPERQSEASAMSVAAALRSCWLPALTLKLHPKPTAQCIGFCCLARAKACRSES